jgi:Tfp pilus assembly protein PilO
MKENIIGKNILYLKKFEQYFYFSLFFLVATFFMIFVIRPNLRQLFFANQKLDQLKKIDEKYNRLLERIIKFQNDLESHRDDLLLIDQAITDSPQINKAINQIEALISKNNLSINSMSVSNVDLKSELKLSETQTLKINLILEGDYENFRKFLTDISNQRKIKIVDNFLIEKESNLNQSTASANLKIQLQVNSFHL